MSTVLVANRGEIACRILRACSEAGYSSIAIYAENDANSLFVELATTSIQLEGESITDTYLNQKQIIDIAKQNGVDAIHPGFGFLSERADFAKAVLDSGINWIGPSPRAITMMGDKMTARTTMKAAGVPVIPGEEIEEEDEDAALIAIKDASKRVGFPLLLKASSGGGGKGMRVVNSFDELDDAVSGARREAIAAFGDGRIYVERLLSGAKHVEIQILADKQGRIIHLGERECSIQRRHQKVFEEAPCPTMTPELRERMGEAAVLAAQAVDYEGAGTVEFLLASNGEFFFLEMNTRIQVEHTITEEVINYDLIKEQIKIASGKPISGKNYEPVGHAIQCRINAEDPLNDFRPSPGRITNYHSPGGHGIRVDTHVYAGYSIPPFYDSMIAKLITVAQTREEALTKMERALGEYIIEGIKTTIPFHQKLMKHPKFREGKFTTKFLEEWDYHSDLEKD